MMESTGLTSKEERELFDSIAPKCEVCQYSFERGLIPETQVLPARWIATLENHHDSCANNGRRFIICDKCKVSSNTCYGCYTPSVAWALVEPL